MEGAGGSMTGVEMLDSGRRRSDDAGPLSMTVSASTKREEVSEMRDETEEKRDLPDRLFIFKSYRKMLKNNQNFQSLALVAVLIYSNSSHYLFRRVVFRLMLRAQVVANIY